MVRTMARKLARATIEDIGAGASRGGSIPAGDLLALWELSYEMDSCQTSLVGIEALVSSPM